MSLGLDKIIEERIARAQREGEFDNLPGAGQPLNLDDDLLIPEELRMVCRVLKNSGYVPPEVHDLRELRQIEAMLAADTGEARTLAARKRMEFLLYRLEQAGLAQVAHAVWAEYADKLAARLEARPPQGQS